VTKNQEMQRLMRLYKQETGVQEVEMHAMADFAIRKGWPLPKQTSPRDLVAKQFAQAAREEVKRDKITSRPYRVNHAYTTTQGGEQMTFWVDIDEAPRKPMLKSLVNRREQMVGDGLQLTLDADHWNSINPTDEPIVMPMDFTDDVEWRKNAPDEYGKTG
jgi:hypothetical protein